MDIYLLNETYSVEFPKGLFLAPLQLLFYINDLPNCLEFTTPCFMLKILKSLPLVLTQMFLLTNDLLTRSSKTNYERTTGELTI